jgi:molecular chaperone DnaK (HSP70)
MHASIRTGSSSVSPAPRPPCVGIDLGTTSSAVALIGPDGKASIKAVIPSVVHFKEVKEVWNLLYNRCGP